MATKGHPSKYKPHILAYIQENAGKVPAKEIADYIGVKVVALRKQCVSWRSEEVEIPSLKYREPKGKIVQRMMPSGKERPYIKIDDKSGWAPLLNNAYETATGEIIPEDKVAYPKDGNYNNTDPKNIALRQIGSYVRPEGYVHPSKGKKMPQLSKERAKSAIPRTRTSHKKKPGTDPNWTQEHLFEKKKIKIPEPPKGSGIRIDSRTVVYPKNVNADVNDLRAKFSRNIVSIKSQFGSAEAI